jgi:DNA replication and repair protein RecF
VKIVLKSLYLRNFRNFAEAEIEFDSAINVIHGDNAQGKTNLLEAIYLISTGRSFRTQHLQELIREKESFFHIAAHLVRDGVSHTVKITVDGAQKRLQLDANIYATLSPLLGILPMILYAPGDTDLITSAPAIRRRFLNLHLAQSDPLYVHHLTRYWRAMKQRNALLRSSSHDSIAVFEAEMATSALYLNKSRHSLLEELKSLIAQQSQSLSSTEELHEVRYHPSLTEPFLQHLEKCRSRDRELGFTTTGPHRDDLSFWISSKPSRLFASEGQKKTAIAALRLAEWHRLASSISEKPLLGLDDLGLPLDETRQKLLRSSLETLGQVFITTPVLGPEFDSYFKIPIAAGSVLK